MPQYWCWKVCLYSSSFISRQGYANFAIFPMSLCPAQHINALPYPVGTYMRVELSHLFGGKMSVSLESIMAILSVIVALPPSLLIILNVARRSHSSSDPDLEPGFQPEHHAIGPPKTSTRPCRQQCSSKQSPHTIPRWQRIPKHMSWPQGQAHHQTVGIQNVHESSTWPVATLTILQHPLPTYQPSAVMPPPLSV
jgi:hypothetical protein